MILFVAYAPLGALKANDDDDDDLACQTDIKSWPNTTFQKQIYLFGM